LTGSDAKFTLASMFKRLKSVPATIFIAILALTGCSHTIYPVATGSHAPRNPAKPVGNRVVVWSNHPGVGNSIIGIAQQAGMTVVERARLQTILNEQGIRLTHTPDDDADVLRVGKLIGADQVIFAEASSNSSTSGRSYYHPTYGGGGRVWTEYNLSVAVRSVNVETGEILWSGEAHYPKPVTNPEEGLIRLSEMAIWRAICMVGSGFEWNDKKGCVKRE